MSEKYQEYVGRYRILRHEELPPEHKASYRINGIDPDTVRNLIWSFDDKEAAGKQLAQCVSTALSYQTYFFVDAGQSEYIEQTAWF